VEVVFDFGPIKKNIFALKIGVFCSKCRWFWKKLDDNIGVCEKTPFFAENRRKL
jgi:hypothetical protein